MQKNELLRAALAYASKFAWPVFPIKPRAKEPLVPHGFQAATTDERQIAEWWKKWPRANIGVATGVKFWALDIDPRSGGSDSLQRLVYQHGALPDTISQVTGGGGQQHFFLCVAGQDIRCHVGLWPGIDIRATGGYVLVPCSIHPSGGIYTWDGMVPLAEQRLAPAPPWLVEAIQNKQSERRPPVEVPEVIKKGEQHKTLFRVGCAMRQKGLGQIEIFNVLWETNQRCEEPGPRENIEKLAASICSQYAAGSNPQAPPASSNGQPASNVRERPVAMTVKELLALQARPHRMLIETTVSKPGAVMIVGAHKSGKTVLAMQMAIAVASGHALMDNYRVGEPGPVIVIEQDDPAGDISMRDYLKASPVPGIEDLPIHFFTRLQQHLGFDFCSWLESEIIGRNARLVVLDSYTALRNHRMPGADLVKVEQEEMRLLDELGKRTECTILILHHISKGSFGMDWSDQAGGSFALGAAVEGLIHITRFLDLPSNAPERLVRGRGRHLEGFEAVIRFRVPTLDFELVLEGPGAPLFLEIRGLLEAFEDRIFEPKELYQELGMARSTASKLIEKLCAADIVNRCGYGKYRLSSGILQALETRH